MVDAKALEQLGRALDRRTVGDVATHVEMRKERVLLEYEPDSSALRRGMSIPRAGIEPRLRAERDNPALGRSRPATARSTLDLPAPEGPTSAMVSAPTSSATASRKVRRA